MSKSKLDKREILTLLNDAIEPICYEESGKRVLVIGDLHEPFCIEGYLEHCKSVYEEFRCDTVVFIGDVIDNHYSSYHPSDPDGYSAGQELDRAISKLALWYNAFPTATVIIGNHDKMAYRKAFTGGLSSKWVKDYKDVLQVPNWNFVESIEIDDVLYVHGEASTAKKTAANEFKSVVQGHRHTEGYIELVNHNSFGMQVGCGVDRKSYSMAYAKHFKHQVLSCGVVLNGKQPFLIRM